MKATCLERYGIENYRNIEKTKETNLQRYGYESHLNNDDIKDKIKKTIQNKYGVDNVFKSNVVKEKIKIAMIKKYGVEHNMQNSEIFEKQQNYKWKDYVLPNGEIIKIQGFENFAIDLLLEKYNETEIIVERKKLPEIWYNMNNKRKRYFCDIYIPKENLIIEVKSDYTYIADLEKNLCKQKACVDTGYNFQFMIFDSKQNLINLNEDKT